MNSSQQKVKQFMDERIGRLEEGMDHLQDRDYQPNEMGDLYNGMLKHAVSFEILHMRRLKDELFRDARLIQANPTVPTCVGETTRTHTRSPHPGRGCGLLHRLLFLCTVGLQMLQNPHMGFLIKQNALQIGDDVRVSDPAALPPVFCNRPLFPLNRVVEAGISDSGG